MSSGNCLYDALLANRSNDPSDFLILPDGETVSFQQAVARSHDFARALQSRGVGAGDRVAVQIGKSPEALFLYFACIVTGAVFLPLNPAYTPRELSDYLEDARPRVFVGEPERISSLGRGFCRERPDLATLGPDGILFARQSGPAGTNFMVTQRQADDLAAILYTSGTTGRPKGAMITHANLLSNAQTLVTSWDFTASDRLLHALPVFHTHGLFVATHVCLLAGASMIYLPRFDLDQVFKAFLSATAMMGVPTFYTRLLADDRLTREATKNMRLFISGSAPLMPQTHELFEERTGHQILERYGMTETNMNTSNPWEGERRAGTVGLPLPGIDVRVIVGQELAEAAAGQVGMIQVRGDNVFKGYWGLEDQTRDSFTSDGYFRTGDLGFFDAEGYLTLVGRDSDMIISGGLNVYPKEVENCIQQVAGVADCAVVGVPHPVFGEGVIAVVVPEADSTLSEQDILSSLRGTVARFKQPKRVIIDSQLPRNAMGKIQKNQLRSRFGALFSGSDSS